MAKKQTALKEPWVDPDDPPEITAEMLAQADAYDGPKLVRRGRPRLDRPKRQVTLRLDQDVIDKLRAAGDGWHSRANGLLRKAVGL